MTEGIRIVSAGNSLMAMRHAPYTTCSALAELIDNSLQARAEHIALIAVDKKERTKGGQQVHRLDQLAVMDDGHGMSAEVIQECLAIGFSRYKEERNGIGRFGYGMSVGSISQSFRVEVYSWVKDGPINYTYIDLPELLELGSETIPPVTEVKRLPLVGRHKWDGTIKKRESGTLIVWNDLDKTRVKVSTSQGIINIFFRDLARIYRHFLDDDDTLGKKRHIEILHMGDDRISILDRKMLLANDPLYLLTPNTLPTMKGIDYSEQATNVEDDSIPLKVKYTNEEGKRKTSMVELIFSIAKPGIRQLGGSSLVGKHYARNTGISFVRAGREIQIDDFRMVNRWNTRERWWGCEIRFLPELDALFGVSADKQKILNIAGYNESNPAPEEIEDDSTQLNIEINRIVKTKIKELRAQIESNPLHRGVPGEEGTSTEQKVNVIIVEDHTKTASKKESKDKTRKQKIDEHKSVLMEKDPQLSEEEAEETAKVKVDWEVDYVLISWPGNMFLDTYFVGAGVQARVNTGSDFYKVFYSDLEDFEDPKAEKAMKIVFMAYSRTEDDLSPRLDPNRKIFPEFRERWGYWVSQLIHISED